MKIKLLKKEFILPDKATLSSKGEILEVGATIYKKPVKSVLKHSTTAVYEIKCKAPGGTSEIFLDIKIPGVSSSNYNVITSGWHTWSGRETRSKDVGIYTVEEKLAKEKTVFVVEPGSGERPISKNSALSYGFVNFREKNNASNLFVGLIPSLTETEDIVFTFKNGDLHLQTRKYLENVDKQRDISFNLLLGEGRYIDLVWQYGAELAKLNTDIKPTKNRAMWFTWAAYGKGVTQKNVSGELQYLKEIGIDTLIIDDGWQKIIGQWEINLARFPDMVGLVEEMKRNGIKPGIWIAPFMTMKESENYNLHPEWFIRDKNRRLINVSNPQVQPTGEVRPILEKARGLDISIKEVREILYQDFVNLVKVGFEVFKVDFASIPFMGVLQNKEKTSVEYYRQFFKELRERVRGQTGKDIEIIGSGAPMLESIGLFEGIRVSPDSASPNFETLPFYGGILKTTKYIPILGNIVKMVQKKIDSNMYEDALAVAGRRAVIFGKSMGLFVDGIHLSDPKIRIDKEEKQKVIEALPAFKGMGLLTNIFVGDSLERSGKKGIKKWKNFIEKFKVGEKAWIEEKTGHVLVEDKK